MDANNNIKQRRELLGMKDKNGYTALQLATALGMTDVVDNLIKLGADPKIADWISHAELTAANISALLASVAMAADRSTAANSNYFRGGRYPGPPLRLTNTTTGETKNIVKSYSTENIVQLIDDVLPTLIKMQAKTSDEDLKAMLQQYIEEVEAFLSVEADKAAKQSILEWVISNQPAMQKYIQEYQAQHFLRTACAQGNLTVVKESLITMRRESSTEYSLEADYLRRNLLFFLVMNEGLSKEHGVEDYAASMRGRYAIALHLCEFLPKDQMTRLLTATNISGNSVFNILSRTTKAPFKNKDAADFCDGLKTILQHHTSIAPS